MLCAVDGRPSSGAVDEALSLAYAARLEFVSVVAAAGADAGADRFASLCERRAWHALEQARALAAARGVAAATQLLRSDDGDVAASLLARAGERDLLIAGSDPDGRPEALHGGGLAGTLARRATGLLLVARRPAAGEQAAPQPQLLVAVDDSPAAHAIVRFAATLAAERDGYVHLVHVRGSDYGPHTRRRLAELSLESIAITGAEPIVDVLRGAQAAPRMIELAQRCAPSVLVVGGAAPGCARAAGGVRAHLVDGAPCSVFVVPATSAQ